MIQAARWEETHVPLKGDLLSQSLRDRQRTNTRRAAALLLRLARFDGATDRRPGRSVPDVPTAHDPADRAASRAIDFGRPGPKSMPHVPAVPDLAPALHENGSSSRATDRRPGRSVPGAHRTPDPAPNLTPHPSFPNPRRGHTSSSSAPTPADLHSRAGTSSPSSRSARDNSHNPAPLRPASRAPPTPSST